MRFSKLYAPTLREAPSDADLPSIKLLIRGGFVRKVAAGVYVYLPLGLKVLEKIQNIVREEIKRIGSQEIMLSIIQPAELWHETGRWDDYGPEMMKLKDRNERYFTLGPTHEEIITAVLRNELNSYKQFPVSLFQIANKYRDEIRPRFGLMRAREFIMKDAYTFHTSWDSLDESYKDFYSAYSRIMERVGMRYRVVEADTGTIGGSESHEFCALADNGESRILYCECGYAATDERAEYLINKENFNFDCEDIPQPELVHTPSMKTVEDVANYLKRNTSNIIKSLLYKGRERYIMALIRGDEEINEAKLKAALQDQSLQMVDPDEVYREFGVPIGFIGPVELKQKVKIIADYSIQEMDEFVVGGMKEDCHLINICPERDFNINDWKDLKTVNEGDPCPHCGKGLKVARGIELGQIFKLGTKYSEKMNATFMDENGKNNPYIMGCYGWGISRTLQAAAEQLHDEHGILWPLSISPYHVIIIVLGDDEKKRKLSEELSNGVEEIGYEVLIDDRNISPGAKFKDADLIGIPLRITLGRKVEDNKIEFKFRNSTEKIDISFEDGINHTLKKIDELLKDYHPID
ncbi:MAG: proline--tRNA ligase [Kosmotogaceae bacterium]